MIFKLADQLYGFEVFNGLFQGFFPFLRYCRG